MASKKLSKKSGTVQSFNISPKGNYEGLLMESDGALIQVNFPEEWASGIAEIARAGKKAEVEVDREEAHEHASHEVYQLVSITSGKKSFSLNDPKGAGGKRFSGKVERLNYALHGEVNGAILDSGDFLHVKPHGAAALELAEGMKVKGIGRVRPMVGGFHVIEADEVNGMSMEKKPKAKKKAAH